jgi:hypothetical protein
MHRFRRAAQWDAGWVVKVLSIESLFCASHGHITQLR